MFYVILDFFVFHVVVMTAYVFVSMFFFNDTATTEIYTVLTHSFPTRRSSDLQFGISPSYLTGKQTPCPTCGGKDRFRFDNKDRRRSEEHTSELQSLMRISYAVFCLKKKKTMKYTQITHTRITSKNHKQYIIPSSEPTTKYTVTSTSTST